MGSALGGTVRLDSIRRSAVQRSAARYGADRACTHQDPTQKASISFKVLSDGREDESYDT
eukprot:CAMPEP_0119538496 /NCGR_PEP_ID=MMETSP1344-20130328/50906_1 /TAXON_ID=236787 /ORGANISM="Florenciella parvula, Strain CCMP2471" /LENGTH=59 /DNA_ID=CAMNT_0007581413 /DNA_START=136 /DNA_END=312 /DNA_ORIENTATION=-